jgi:hypothetical protein
MVSHDLRTPSAVINVRAQVLQSRQPYDKDGVRIIREEAVIRRASSMIWGMCSGWRPSTSC